MSTVPASVDADALQKRLHAEVEKFQQVQRDMQKLTKTRQQLEAQLTENTIVKQELDLIKPGSPACVFKLIGPLLAKQELAEAKQNVEKRLEYITGEIKRLETSLKDLEKKRELQQESLKQCQAELQQVQKA